MEDKLRILIVDDEPDIGDFISDVAIDMGFEAIAIHQANQFEEIYPSGFDVVVLDLVLPECDGVELLRFIADQPAPIKIILISGYDAGVLHSAQKLALEHGLNVIASLSKPFNHEELEALLGSITTSPENHYNSQTGSLKFPSKEELQKAISEGELEAWFQPQLEMSSGSILGVEALVRWNHPQRGLLMPNTIVPLAEQSDMIDALTSEVMEQSFKQLGRWQKQGLQTRVSVNITANCLKELSRPEKISAKLEQYQLQSEQIVVEVTESGLMHDLVQSLDVLTRLRLKGIDLSIDDFGTGYSSMVQLYRAPFSEIKIDQSFVRQAASDAEAQTIVEITILLGHKLDMKVIAEGVEDQLTWNLLSDLGCDAAQGYFIAKPMPGDQLLGWLEQHKNNPIFG